VCTGSNSTPVRNAIIRLEAAKNHLRSLLYNARMYKSDIAGKFKRLQMDARYGRPKNNSSSRSVRRGYGNTSASRSMNRGHGNTSASPMNRGHGNTSSSRSMNRGHGNASSSRSMNRGHGNTSSHRSMR
jgi:hypothetical protein